MDKAKQKVEHLIKQGKHFSYEESTGLSGETYAQSYAPEYVAWRTRVASAITTLLGDSSPAMIMLNKGLDADVLGRGIYGFRSAQGYILGALQAVLDVLEEDSFDELQSNAKATTTGRFSNKVFVVHGHDEVAKNELAAVLQEMGLDPIVLHRKPDEGQTIIEKFEKYSDVGYAFILLTPDEVAYLKSQENISNDERKKENRARPNVIFEFGYFVGKLGRSRVCCLYTGGVALPSDVSGMLYKEYKASIKEAAYDITKELKAQGYKLK